MDLKLISKNVLSKITRKKAIIFVIVVVALVGLVKSNIIQNKFFASKKTVVQNVATVKKGTLLVGISGSGPIIFTNSSKIYSKTNGTINKSNYKEGDAVKAGDVIYELDPADAQASIDNNKNNLAQSQISAIPTDQDVANLNVKALTAGLITNIAVNVGDTVQKGGTVATIADTSKLKVSLTYNATDFAKIAVGQGADVVITTTNQSIRGVVTSVSNEVASSGSGSAGNASGSAGNTSSATKSFSVEIQVTNPGSITSATTVSADINTTSGNVSSTSPGTLDFVTKNDVASLTGGTVKSISVSKNQRVSIGKILVVMKNDDVLRAKQLSDLKLANTTSQVNANLKTLENFKIVAPIDGVITKLTNKVGDTIKAGDEVSDVSNPTQMQFDISIDELDIAKIVVGQKTTITVDALPSSTTTPVNGEVAKIAVEGTAVSGVTTFPVTIKINDNLDKLKGGMNANGSIQVTNKADVLTVPIEAVTTMGTKSFVWLKTGAKGSTAGGFGGGNFPGGTGTTSGTRPAGGTGGYPGAGGRTGGAGSGSTTSATNYYEGAVRTEVVVGANNDTNIEITSGLKEGQVVVLPQTQAASKTTTTKAPTGASGLGGLTGGAPGGGFSGGGRGN